MCVEFAIFALCNQDDFAMKSTFLRSLSFFLPALLAVNGVTLDVQATDPPIRLARYRQPDFPCERRLYDFVVPRDGNIREAIEAANGRKDTTRRFRIFVMPGDYVVPCQGERTGGDGQKYPDPRMWLRTPNVSIVGEERDCCVVRNVLPEATWDNGFGAASPLEGIGNADVLILEKAAHDCYFQDITLRNGMADRTGRNIVLHDRSTHTICRDVRLWGYQDTYVSNNQHGQYYFIGGVIRGCTDYICGKGDVFFDGVTFQQCGTGGYICAPSVPKEFGYVMSSCSVKVETPDVTYYWGRPWGKETPTAIWLYTGVDKGPITKDKKGYNAWADMGSGGWPARFAEYGSHLLSTLDTLDLTGRRSLWVDKEGGEHPNNPYVTRREALKYQLKNVFPDWKPRDFTNEAYPIIKVEMKGRRISWTDSPDALLYAVCLDGRIVDFTTDHRYTTKVSAVPERWSIRPANQMGGLGQAYKVGSNLERILEP